MAEPNKKRHHYVPVAYLRRFADGRGRVFAYAKDRPDAPIHVRPDEIAFEKHYYAQPLPGGGRDHNRLENLFSSVEAEWPGLAAAIAEGRRLDPTAFEGLFAFMALQRVRVPAARDAAEYVLAEHVKNAVLDLDAAGKLPPRPPEIESLDTLTVAIDPHRSIEAMTVHMQGLGSVFDRLGYEALHLPPRARLITSDNPVIYFDPRVPTRAMRPYGIDPARGDVELLFPVGPHTLLRGRTSIRQRFAAKGLRHVRLPDSDAVRRFNRLIARFGYRWVFAVDRRNDDLVASEADRSPVPQAIRLGAGDRTALAFETVFGRRRTKPRWRNE